MLTRRLEETSWTVETRKSENRQDKKFVVYDTYLPITVVVLYTSIYVLIGCEIIPHVGCCDPQGPQLLYFI